MVLLSRRESVESGHEGPPCVAGEGRGLGRNADRHENPSANRRNEAGTSGPSGPQRVGAGREERPAAASGSAAASGHHRRRSH